MKDEPIQEVNKINLYLNKIRDLAPKDVRAMKALTRFRETARSMAILLASTQEGLKA